MKLEFLNWFKKSDAVHSPRALGHPGRLLGSGRRGFRVRPEPEELGSGLAYVVDFSRALHEAATNAATFRVAAERFIQKRLSSVDRLIALDGRIFHLVLMETDRRIGDLKCSLMLTELHAQFLSDIPPEYTVAYVQVKRDGRLLLEPIGNHTGPLTHAPDIDRQPRDRSAEDSECNGWVLPAQRARTEEPLWTYTDSSPRFTDWNLICVYFAPIWDCQNGAVAIFSCVATLQDALAKTVLPTAQFAELDERTFRVAVDQIATGNAHGKTCYLSVPIHLSTVVTQKHRNRLLAKMSVVRDIRPEILNYLIFELVDIPEGIASISAFDAVSTIRPFSRQVHVLVDLEFTDFHALSGCGVDAVGADLSKYKITDPGLLEAMKVFAERASRARMPHYWSSIQSRPACLAGIESGARFMSGPVVQPLVDRPRHPYRLKSEDLLAKP